MVDGEPNEPVSRATLVFAVLATALGLALVGAAAFIGIRLDWVITDPIETRRSEISAWVPMLLMTVIGLGIAVFGIRMLWSLPRPGDHDSPER